jgi:hypothetical protein
VVIQSDYSEGKQNKMSVAFQKELYNTVITYVSLLEIRDFVSHSTVGLVAQF